LASERYNYAGEEPSCSKKECCAFDYEEETGPVFGRIRRIRDDHLVKIIDLGGLTGRPHGVDG